jgi:hypothetical protein
MAYAHCPNCRKSFRYRVSAEGGSGRWRAQFMRWELRPLRTLIDGTVEVKLLDLPIRSRGTPPEDSADPEVELA